MPKRRIQGARTNSRAHKRTDCGARMSLSPPLPPPTSAPKSDDVDLQFLWLLLIVLVVIEWRTEFLQKQWSRIHTRGDPINPVNMHFLPSDSSPSELRYPALFVEFMRADRLDIVAQDTESQKSKAFSDNVSKKIKERRENPRYLPQTMNSAKCYIDSDSATGEDWGLLALGPKLLQRCKETNGRLILLMTPECKKNFLGQERWVGEPRLTHTQEQQKQMAISWGVDVREIEIRAGDAHEKVMTLVNTNVVMEKEKARQFMAADCVHVLSTQYKDKVAFELARQADDILDGMPKTFCYNPNEDNVLVADNDSLANEMWLEIFENMVEHATASTSRTNKKRRGKVFQLIMDGQQTSMQFSEEKLAKKYGVELVKITVDASWTKERLRPILMEAHARA